MADAILASSGIYQIRNTVNGKVYVGSAVNFARRFSQHQSALRNGKHDSGKLQNAWNKYGEDSFAFSVIERVVEVSNLISREQYWIDALQAVRCGYNINPTAGSSLGVRRSDEFKKKCSEAKKRITPETREKMSAAQMGVRKGIKRPKFNDEWLANISAGQRGRIFTEEHKNKISASLAGRQQPKKRGVSLSLDHREKIKAGLARYAERHDAYKTTPAMVAAREQSSVSMKMRWADPEYRDRMLLARKKQP
jgi:group I intron endonuclease